MPNQRFMKLEVENPGNCLLANVIPALTSSWPSSQLSGFSGLFALYGSWRRDLANVFSLTGITVTGAITP